MPGPVVFVLVAIGAAVSAGGCRRSLARQDAGQARVDVDAHSDGARESSGDEPPACFPLFHACTTTEECCAPNRCLNITGAPACQQEGPRLDAIQRIDLSQPDGIPMADPDGGTCAQRPGEFPGVVCFGSDPAPYEQYLTPVDGGPGPGQCPAARDFIPLRGEGCAYLSCGPLLGSALADLPDAGAAAGDAGTGCCFVVVRVCGV